MKELVSLKKIIAVDPGGRRIGIAISDETGNLARPLSVIIHKSRHEDAVRIIQVAAEQSAETIIIGAAYGNEGEETPASRKANRLAGEIHAICEIKVQLWDESGSTRKAKDIKMLIGTSKRMRKGHQDSTAAAVILQDFLDSLHNKRQDQS